MVGLGIAGALAAIASWVTSGPGPRRFSVVLPFVGRGPGSEAVGRVAFGGGAVLMYVFILVFAIVGVQRLQGRR